MWQRITGRIEVLDDVVRVEIDLPWIMQLLRDTVAKQVRGRGVAMLGEGPVPSPFQPGLRRVVTAAPTLQRPRCSASLDSLFRRSLDRSVLGKLGIDLLDRPALYLNSPDQEGEPGNYAPGCK